jgi:hypothetical protein
MSRVKSVYLTVRRRGEVSTVFYRQFFDAKSYNDYIKTEEFKAKYPEEEYQITKDIY